MHPEVAEFVGLPKFTHWLVIPETDRHYRFAKAVVLYDATCISGLRARNIEVFRFQRHDVTPYCLPTKPEYKDQVTG